MVVLLEKNKVYRNVKVENASDIYGLDLLTGDDVSCVIPKTESAADIVQIPHINDTISAPVNQGDIMGYVEYQHNGLTFKKVNLLAARSIDHKPEPESLTGTVEKVFNDIFVRIGLYVAGFFVFFLLLRITLRRISRKINSKRRRYS